MCKSRIAAFALSGLSVLLLAAGGSPPVPPSEAVPATGAPPTAVLFSVPLPLSGVADTQLMGSLDKFLADLPPGDTRPIVILEFRAGDLSSGDTGDFERALALARYLASDRFSRVRTVAYVPATVEGHAVLAVLACEEIIIAPDARLGAAGRSETSIDSTMVAAYREIAERRRTIPAPLVLGMLDPRLAVVEVQLVGGGTRYVLADELETLRAEAKIWKENRVVPEGEPVLLSGNELRMKYGFASHLAADRKELAESLQIPLALIRDAAVARDGWQALRVDVRGSITSRTVDDVVRAVRQAQTDKATNLLCVWVNSSGGLPAPALRLVNLLAELDPREMRTVAFVPDEARSVAALAACVCDEAYASDEAVLGGPGDTQISPAELTDLRASLQELARVKLRDWSPLLALVDPQLELYRYRHEGTGVVRHFCDEELAQQPDPVVWKREAKIELQDGLTGVQAKEIGLLRDTAPDLATALRHFNLQAEIAVAKHNPVVAAIERLGAQPWLARVLLFVAFFALISEASAPGIGVAGFLSGVSFLLFFWSQFLNGTAGWLELTLFAGGLACIAMEIFVLPGLGVFGVGGGIMILTSIILASQTFIFPRNSYQLEQFSNSLFTMVTACGGMFAAIFVLRRYLADSWLLNRVMLPSPAEDLDLDALESLVDWDYLEGKRGVTTTQLTPSGKARFGDDEVNVISDGVLVPRGTAIRVTQVLGNRVLVEPLEES
ncbi:MAG: NfeD family protein [Pirellulaceae bacterium]